jgi:hypothetical protein
VCVSVWRCVCVGVAMCVCVDALGPVPCMGMYHQDCVGVAMCVCGVGVGVAGNGGTPEPAKRAQLASHIWCWCGVLTLAGACAGPAEAQKA